MHGSARKNDDDLDIDVIDPIQRDAQSSDNDDSGQKDVVDWNFHQGLPVSKK